MKCSQLVVIDNRPTCKVASWWAGQPVPVAPDACKVCLGCPVPRGLNRVTVGVAMSHLAKFDQQAYQAKLPSAMEHLVEPSAPEALVRYAKATAEWVAKGRPTRSDSEVLQILDICRDCPEWLPDREACRFCGCFINSGDGWTNKARRLNEHCPLEKW